jgi:hypothetical protein
MTPLPQKHRNETNKFSISQTDVNKKKNNKTDCYNFNKDYNISGKKT